MHIDWFTVIAQMLNFLVLVWLLKHFLYQPVIVAMEQREARIRETVAKAKDEKKHAGQERAELEEKTKALNDRSEALLKKAAAEAGDERKRLLGEARQEFERMRQKYAEALDAEKEALKHEISRRAGDEVLAITRQVLDELADCHLEQQMVSRFCQRLSELSDEEKGGLLKPGDESPDRKLVIRSAFELNEENRAALEQSVTEKFGNAPLDFEMLTSIGCGIELAADGRKISWTINDYLRSLESAIDETLSRKIPTNAKPTGQLAPADA